MAGLGIFLMVSFKKYKLYNLIKREIHILTTKIIKKYVNILILQLPSTSFYILKSLHDSLIINITSYTSFNVHNQSTNCEAKFKFIGIKKLRVFSNFF